jgi:thiaminase/transcriptional activator TenA
MSRSRELWQANSDIAAACLEHPFVQGIGDGSLPRHKFMYYIGQDAFYLEAFARAYTIAAAKVPDWQDFQTLHALAGGVFEELRMHTQFAASWDIDLRTVEAGPTTRRYTDFLLATAWGSEVGLTAVAMSPCMRLYAFLGQQLAQTERPEHVYSNWVRTYSSPDIEDLVQQLERLVERYASDTPSVRAAYRYAMECERDFFQAAWEASPEPHC